MLDGLATCIDGTPQEHRFGVATRISYRFDRVGKRQCRVLRGAPDDLAERRLTSVCDARILADAMLRVADACIALPEQHARRGYFEEALTYYITHLKSAVKRDL